MKRVLAVFGFWGKLGNKVKYEGGQLLSYLAQPAQQGALLF